ncbi:S66 peptidase family protein [Fodinicola feengrottensis]|uniref:S66 peptidase family protein n=1 Tax=Fodinicola feengrottensis TaxID=435914 RepID=UPI0013D205F4|nr:LD-carboxypeptidase [Fodinicola feengrottensis]
MALTLRGRALRAGDRVRLVSPASYPSREWVDELVRLLTGWGLVVEIGEHALDRWGFMAGRDEDRIADLDAAFGDPGVRAVVATRGGAGAYRIVDGLDFAAIRADPKPLVGMSDITNLHIALWRHCRLATIHAWPAGDRAIASLHQLLTTTKPLTVVRDLSSPTAALDVPGTASGPLVGGNFTAIQGFVGAGVPSLEGAILCVESPVTPADPVLLDASLRPLVESGSLDGVRAVAIGDLGSIDRTV